MDGLLDWLLDPYRFEFMRRALAALLITSVVGSAVGAFVVNKGLSFAGDALAHVTLAGIAIAFVAGTNVSLGALFAAVAAALLIGFLRRHASVTYDTAIGIIFVAGFALGLAVLSSRSTYTPNLFSFVFGDVLGVSNEDLLGELALGVGVLLFIAAFYRELLMVSFDPAMSGAAGVPRAFFEYGLLVLVAVAVVVALQLIGVVLVSAMLVVPAATGGLLARRMSGIIALAIGCAALASVAGLHASYHAEVATSSAVVLSSCAIFALALSGTLLARWREGVRAPAARGEGGP